MSMGRQQQRLQNATYENAWIQISAVLKRDGKFNIQVHIPV